MTAIQIPRRTLTLLALSLAMFAGCGGNPPEIDTAETIKNEPAVKPTPTPAPESAPAPTPTAEPSKDAPKG